VTRRTGIAVLACALLLALPTLSFARAVAVPKATSTYLLGGRMIRAEIGLKTPDGGLHDYRVDRGRLTKRYAAGALTLVERDGAKTAIKVASSARVTSNGKDSSLRALRAGMQVAVLHDGDLPADTVYATGAKGTPTIPYASVSFLLGPRMLRAEIALKTPDNAVHDFLLDRGRIRQVNGANIILREADATIVTVSTSPFARVKLNGKPASYAQLRKGMMATTMHDGSKPTDQIWATGK
jgi:hypothetical protein